MENRTDEAVYLLRNISNTNRYQQHAGAGLNCELTLKEDFTQNKQ